LNTSVRSRHAKLRRRSPNRSIGGDIGMYLFLALLCIMMAVPMVYAVTSSLKPLDELFKFPPTLFARNPTFDNFSDLFVTMSQSYVPFSRYVFNTVFVTFAGTAGEVIIASMAAYVLAKYNFPGGRMFFNVVITALMFTGYVTAIPNYLIMTKLHIVDTYWALILPAFAAPIGLFLMKQYMEGIPDSIIEAAKIDGANEWTTFIKLVMPNAKPAWLTIIIFSVQSLWNNNASNLIYTENLKPVTYALQQIQLGGIVRTGQTAAVTVIIMLLPVLIFVFAQSQVLETMATSGLKD
jgi:ABC-type glycerol-3-phosphate transport system permease component